MRHARAGRAGEGAKLAVLADTLAVCPQRPLQTAMRRAGAKIDRKTEHPRRHAGMRQGAVTIPLPPVAAVDRLGGVFGQGADIKMRILPLADPVPRRTAGIGRIINKAAFPVEGFCNGLLEQGIGLIEIRLHDFLFDLDAVNVTEHLSAVAPLRHDWSADDILALLEAPLLDLLHRAQTVHRQYHPENTIQLASLLSIKTGGCPEDCSYCPQSAHFQDATGTAKEPLMDVETVLAAARTAKDNGATRFCMGAAWRSAPKGNSKGAEQFDRVLEMVRGVREMGLEACATLGMLTDEQAAQLADAGLTAYNHNLDSGPNFYGNIISTRSYQDRLDTLQRVRDAGVTLCTGGIIGMGETLRDRAEMLQVLASLDPHPESVPINALVPVAGTPLAGQTPVDPLELVRMCAAARITMPQTRVRLSAGRMNLNREAQILCFMAGANSIFFGEKLLTTGNNDADADRDLIAAIGARVLPPDAVIAAPAAA